MPPDRHPTELDLASPPFDQFKSIQRLSTERSGKGSGEYARHQLYAGRDPRTRTGVLIKVTSKPGVVYEQNLSNEIANLETINRKLPDSRHFPLVREHGRLPDGRLYLITSLFDEFPLANSIGDMRLPDRMVGHLRTTIEVARALIELHGLPIYHVDLNPMNILYRTERGRPVIRIVDFESSYDPARHAAGVFYDPPTTPRFSAPEVSHQAPDGRADLFSLGAVLYTLLGGYGWTWEGDVGACVAGDGELDAELKGLLRRAVDLDPGGRFASVLEFERGLGSYLERIWPGRSW